MSITFNLNQFVENVNKISLLTGVKSRHQSISNKNVNFVRKMVNRAMLIFCY